MDQCCLFMRYFTIYNWQPNLKPSLYTNSHHPPLLDTKNVANHFLILNDVVLCWGRLSEFYWTVLARERLWHNSQGQDGRREGVHRLCDHLEDKQLADPSAGGGRLQHGHEESRLDRTPASQHRPLQVLDRRSGWRSRLSLMGLWCVCRPLSGKNVMRDLRNTFLFTTDALQVHPSVTTFVRQVFVDNWDSVQAVPPRHLPLTLGVRLCQGEDPGPHLGGGHHSESLQELRQEKAGEAPG